MLLLQNVCVRFARYFVGESCRNYMRYRKYVCRRIHGEIVLKLLKAYVRRFTYTLVSISILFYSSAAELRCVKVLTFDSTSKH